MHQHRLDSLCLFDFANGQHKRVWKYRQGCFVKPRNAVIFGHSQSYQMSECPRNKIAVTRKVAVLLSDAPTSPAISLATLGFSAIIVFIIHYLFTPLDFAGALGLFCCSCCFSFWVFAAPISKAL